MRAWCKPPADDRFKHVFGPLYVDPVRWRVWGLHVPTVMDLPYNNVHSRRLAAAAFSFQMSIVLFAVFNVLFRVAVPVPVVLDRIEVVAQPTSNTVVLPAVLTFRLNVRSKTNALFEGAVVRASILPPSLANMVLPETPVPRLVITGSGLDDFDYIRYHSLLDPVYLSSCTTGEPTASAVSGPCSVVTLSDGAAVIQISILDITPTPLRPTIVITASHGSFTARTEFAISLAPIVGSITPVSLRPTPILLGQPLTPVPAISVANLNLEPLPGVVVRAFSHTLSTVMTPMAEKVALLSGAVSTVTDRNGTAWFPDLRVTASNSLDLYIFFSCQGRFAYFGDVAIPLHLQAPATPIALAMNLPPPYSFAVLEGEPISDPIRVSVTSAASGLPVAGMSVFAMISVSNGVPCPDYQQPFTPSKMLYSPIAVSDSSGVASFRFSFTRYGRAGTYGVTFVALNAATSAVLFNVTTSVTEVPLTGLGEWNSLVMDACNFVHVLRAGMTADELAACGSFDSTAIFSASAIGRDGPVFEKNVDLVITLLNGTAAPFQLSFVSPAFDAFIVGVTGVADIPSIQLIPTAPFITPGDFYILRVSVDGVMSDAVPLIPFVTLNTTAAAAASSANFMAFSLAPLLPAATPPAASCSLGRGGLPNACPTLSVMSVDARGGAVDFFRGVNLTTLNESATDTMLLELFASALLRFYPMVYLLPASPSVYFQRGSRFSGPPLLYRPLMPTNLDCAQDVACLIPIDAEAPSGPYFLSVVMVWDIAGIVRFPLLQNADLLTSQTLVIVRNPVHRVSLVSSTPTSAVFRALDGAGNPTVGKRAQCFVRAGCPLQNTLMFASQVAPTQLSDSLRDAMTESGLLYTAVLWPLPSTCSALGYPAYIQDIMLSSQENTGMMLYAITYRAQAMTTLDSYSSENPVQLMATLHVFQSANGSVVPVDQTTNLAYASFISGISAPVLPDGTTVFSDLSISPSLPGDYALVCEVDGVFSDSLLHVQSIGTVRRLVIAASTPARITVDILEAVPPLEVHVLDGLGLPLSNISVFAIPFSLDSVDNILAARGSPLCAPAVSTPSDALGVARFPRIVFCRSAGRSTFRLDFVFAPNTNWTVKTDILDPAAPHVTVINPLRCYVDSFALSTIVPGAFLDRRYVPRVMIVNGSAPVSVVRSSGYDSSVAPVAEMVLSAPATLQGAQCFPNSIGQCSFPSLTVADVPDGSRASIYFAVQGAACFQGVDDLSILLGARFSASVTFSSDVGQLSLSLRSGGNPATVIMQGAIGVPFSLDENGVVLRVLGIGAASGVPNVMVKPVLVGQPSASSELTAVAFSVSNKTGYLRGISLVFPAGLSGVYVVSFLANNPLRGTAVISENSIAINVTNRVLDVALSRNDSSVLFVGQRSLVLHARIVASTNDSAFWSTFRVVCSLQGGTVSCPASASTLHVRPEGGRWVGDIEVAPIVILSVLNGEKDVGRPYPITVFVDGFPSAPYTLAVIDPNGVVESPPFQLLLYAMAIIFVPMFAANVVGSGWFVTLLSLAATTLAVLVAVGYIRSVLDTPGGVSFMVGVLFFLIALNGLLFVVFYLFSVVRRLRTRLHCLPVLSRLLAPYSSFPSLRRRVFADHVRSLLVGTPRPREAGGPPAKLVAEDAGSETSPLGPDPGGDGTGAGGREAGAGMAPRGRGEQVKQKALWVRDRVLFGMDGPDAALLLPQRAQFALLFSVMMAILACGIFLNIVSSLIPALEAFKEQLRTLLLTISTTLASLQAFLVDQGIPMTLNSIDISPAAVSAATSASGPPMSEVGNLTNPDLIQQAILHNIQQSMSGYDGLFIHVVMVLRGAVVAVPILSSIIDSFLANNTVERLSNIIYVCLTLSSVIASCNAAASLLLVARAIRRDILLSRRGIHRWDPSDPPLIGAPSFIGMQAFHLFGGFFLCAFVFFILFFILACFIVFETLRATLVAFVVNVLLPTVGVVVAVKAILFLANKFFAIRDGAIAHPHVFALLDTAGTYMGMASGIGGATARVPIAIVSVIITYSRCDVSIAPLDPGHTAYLAMLCVEHMTGNPVVLTFVDLLNACAHPAASVEGLELVVRDMAEEDYALVKRRRRLALRLWVAITIFNNPGLVLLRRRGVRSRAVSVDLGPCVADGTGAEDADALKVPPV